MSTRNSSTRILEAALTLIAARGADVTMAEIASQAGVSRQAVYLNFEDRADLLLALVRYVHEKFGVAEETRAIDGAKSGIEAVRKWVSLQARLNPVIWPVARTFEIARRTDEAAQQGWQDRQMHRLETCRRIVARMDRERGLKPGIDQEAAADLLWSIASLQTWEELVVERGWTAAEYEKRITQTLLDGLTNHRA